MRRVAASEAREVLADLLNEVAYRNARIVIHRHGKDVGVLISVRDLERLREFERRSREDVPSTVR